MRPPSPKGVRLRLHDGRQIPVQVRYDGTDADGLARFSVVTDFELGEIAGVLVEVFPARTALLIPAGDLS